ncbi:unnamed protein product [Lampetra fluviatilis]
MMVVVELWPCERRHEQALVSQRASAGGNGDDARAVHDDPRQGSSGAVRVTAARKGDTRRHAQGEETRGPGDEEAGRENTGG